MIEIKDLKPGDYAQFSSKSSKWLNGDYCKVLYVDIRTDVNKTFKRITCRGAKTSFKEHFLEDGSGIDNRIILTPINQEEAHKIFQEIEEKKLRQQKDYELFETKRKAVLKKLTEILTKEEISDLKKTTGLGL